VEPVPLRVSGRIPDWLDGVLLKNGPGTFKDKQVCSHQHLASSLVI
jgi:carotenoid cleavage dioxygenase-like enzyme